MHNDAILPAFEDAVGVGVGDEVVGRCGCDGLRVGPVSWGSNHHYGKIAK